MKKKAFTLIELIVVIAIIAILAAVVAPNAFRAIEKSKITRGMSDSKALRVASEAYYADIGFWPPDVNRGADPGFMQPDAACPERPSQLVGYDPVAQGFPANWNNIIQTNWDGPYLEQWPIRTPWAGLYDWNYWPAGAVRYGVTVPPGCYIGIQGDYNDNNHISASSEKTLVDNGFDEDKGVNGESQLLMVLF